MCRLRRKSASRIFVYNLCTKSSFPLPPSSSINGSGNRSLIYGELGRSVHCIWIYPYLIASIHEPCPNRSRYAILNALHLRASSARVGSFPLLQVQFVKGSVLICLIRRFRTSPPYRCVISRSHSPAIRRDLAVKTAGV